MVTRPSPPTTANKQDSVAKRATTASPRSPGSSPTRRATNSTPRSPGSSPTRRATSTTPRSPGRSPTRGANGNGRASKHRSVQAQASDNMMSRAVQWVILLAGVMLLFSFLFGGKLGPAFIGVTVVASAFPPMRRHVDKMLVGTPYGDEADQAAILRIAFGVGIVIFVLVFLP